MDALLQPESIKQQLELMFPAAIAVLELGSVKQAYKRFISLFHITDIPLLLVNPRAVHNYPL